ncbi:hypothetical protein BOTBODRAFT_65254 [Botryobasidium botryosum FD-172 SS1]|uniref:Uncharacterized protein n=1 Tax=Botryobasidium botryosum (strain FD-172 SS1) TaxID=930990 RepID=A0A067MJ17_BOTB1|nr:hypothetical protein BOTBODRAFT_65254 [Botryobasidium botryosum FD-172 SS1]
MATIDDSADPKGSHAAVRAKERAKAIAILSNDPKYKKYTNQVEKCLATFDSISEWADFISFLTKLLKTFQSYMQYKEIPRKLIVAKRLAQCLNPALPSGVHQRALDVYAFILTVIGPEGLQRDLQLWSSGLFPFLQYAATSVKPALLQLYDTHYVQLREGLRPVTKAFILALLPGLEEEAGEFFEKVLGLLDRLSGTISPVFFFQNMWLILLTTPSARGTASSYLSRRLPKMNGDEDITPIVGQDLGLMIRAFAAALDDDQLLVRRSVLDLLVQSLRLDSAAMKGAQQEDRVILMKAAMGVVLRRDLSLNRRLYSWLLGPDEQSHAQIKFAQEYTLELLRSTLKDEMVSPWLDGNARPYKIFISLLDKWEIGSLLTDVLLLDALKAVKDRVLSWLPPQILISANTLYEAVEPHIVWKHLFNSMRLELLDQSSGTEAVQMVRFILTTFRMHEEEVQQIHLPLVFAAILNLINDLFRRDHSRIFKPSLISALGILVELLQHVSHVSLDRPLPALDSDGAEKDLLTSPYACAVKFYGIPSPPLEACPEAQKSMNSTMFALVFEDLVAISTLCASAVSSGVRSSPPFPSADVTCFIHSLDLLLGLLSRHSESYRAVEVDWKPSEWLTDILTFVQQTTSFALADRIVSLCAVLNKNVSIQPCLDLNQQQVMAQLLHGLLHFLQPKYALYHLRAVQQIWALEKTTGHRYAEPIISQTLTAEESKYSSKDFDAFGVLWRLTDDNLIPGFRLKLPMLIVMDTLKSDDPRVRRTGETWMRCSLKSYLRVLDPVLFDLMDPATQRSTVVVSHGGRDIRSFRYERPFDQHRVAYFLDSLLSLVRFGGQSFSKVARATPVKRCLCPELITRAETANVIHATSSYMDMLLEILIRYLQSEPKPSLENTLGPGNSRIHVTAIELLQAIISRGELDATTLATLEAVIVSKLYVSVHVDRLELQNKLLHVLHSILFASTPSIEGQRPKSRADIYADSSDDMSQTRRQPSFFTPPNPLLVQTLMDGISRNAKRPTLQHWVDFVLMTVPLFQGSRHHLVFPLSDCLCRQIRAALVDLRGISDRGERYSDATISATTDSELVMLLNALERLVLVSVAAEGSAGDDDATLVDRANPELGGLLGYVSNVFSADNTANNIPDDFLSPRSPGYRCLHEAIRTLYTIWLVSSWTPPTNSGGFGDSLVTLYTRVRARCRRVLERIFRAQSAEIMESIVECWQRDENWISIPANKSRLTFEMMDFLTSSAQTAVHMLCESISYRTQSSAERAKRHALNPNLSDAVLFHFLEEYLSQLEGPIAVQVWGRFLAFAKEVIANAHGYKLLIFPMLRCATVLSEKITQTSAVDDRRMRRELQETFTKLVDTCVLIAGRSFEQGNWIRRNNKDLMVPAINGRQSPLPRSHTEQAPIDDKGEGASMDDSLKPAWGDDLIDQIQEFIATRVLPNVRRVLLEGDKIASVCTNIAYYIVNPAMKSKTSHTLDVEAVILDILREMSKIPSASKAWRGPVSDALNDNRFFNTSPKMSGNWRPLVRALMDADRQGFAELIGKVGTASATNIFTNREYEMRLRSLNLRRLSFVVFSGEKNQFLTQLPSIQEKLVDILRTTVVAPSVHSEAYLCMRVLLLRLSPQNLSSFWPVILNEMLRVFEQIIVSPPADGSEDLPLILSACKLLDLLLVLRTEEFQVHQWMFVTDTVDAVYRPDSWEPEALLDQLAEVIADLPALVPDSKGKAKAKPPISSIRELLPFFSHVSIASYESVYASAGGNVDWEAIESGVLEEMFEGR